MRREKNKIFTAAISVILCISLAFGGMVSASAAINIGDIIGGITGGGSINISQLFTEWLKDEINKESLIDKFVENIKNQFTGEGSDDAVVEDPEEGEGVVLDKGEAGNVAELFNLTVNELKKGSPGFVKTENATMDAKIAVDLAAGLGAVNGIVASLISNKDLAAGVIDGINKDTQVTTKYPVGNDVKNNIPVTGKDYVACLTADDIKDYTITIYKSGAYRIHIDLVDVEGASSQSGLAHVFDTTDKANATINLLGGSVNIGVKFKYVNNYVECQVNRDGQLTSYTMNTGVTFAFQQEDGSYSSEMPYIGIDFEEEGVIYNITTDFSNIDYSLRKMGDANQDGKITSADARLVLRMASRLDPVSDSDKPYCDVTTDGKITASDARLILRTSSKLDTLPTTSEALGIDEYEKSEATQKHIDDLLVLMMAYQAAKDEEEQQQLQDEYENKYDGESTTEAEEETTLEINTPAGTVDDVLDFIGGIIGGRK